MLRRARTTRRSPGSPGRQGLNLRPTTQARDRIYIANYINTPLGNRQLKHLTPQVIRRWVATLSEDYAPSTVHKAFQLLQAALDAAVRDGLLPANPAHKTPLPRIEKSDHRYLTIDETHDLADAISHRYQALVYTGALAGLRPGEISGLRIDNLDLLRSTLTVTQTATEPPPDAAPLPSRSSSVTDSANTSAGTDPTPRSCSPRRRGSR